MSHTHSLATRVIALALILSPAGPFAGWQPAALAAAKKVTTTSVTTPPDGGWPRTYTTKNAATVVLSEPQVASWPAQKDLTMYAAVSYKAAGSTVPAFGVLTIVSRTKVDVASRLVNFDDFKLTEANFQTIPKDQLDDVISEIKDAIPHESRVIGLDRVMAAVNDSDITPKNTQGIKADPPAIFVSDIPAVLVNLDGDPIWSPIQNNQLQFAVNTNWDLFQHPAGKTFFLRVEGSWLAAESWRGPWKQAGKLPDNFNMLPDDGNWADVKAALPGKPFEPGTYPTVYVSTVPAELVVLKGAPQYQPVAGTSLTWISNTESDVFRVGTTGTIYYLVAGRWFSAPQAKGPWTFATPNLPDDFKKIPLEHPRSRVLASVPGTRQAIEAIALAQVPQTAKVKRSEIKAPDVAYGGGQPTFEAIPQTSVARAVNTDKDIIKVGDLYYMCYQGVWFRSTTANGPWTVTDSVPKQIYEIPISSPSHNVTYVTVEDSDDEWVEFAAAAAYTGMMIGWGAMMWDSGWYYPPYYGGYYGGYYGHYPTYGYGAYYNPWTGAYGRGGAVYGPYGGAGYGARYNPTTGTYARGAAAYGPGGSYRAGAEAWNPRTGTTAQTRQGGNVYGSWGQTSVQRGNQWASTSRVTSNVTGTTTRATTGGGGGGAITRRGPEGGGGIARTGGGDIYAGRDGNVYRNQGGTWQKYENGGWSNTSRQGSSATRDQLNQARASRSDGAQRTRDLSSVQSRSSSGGSRGSFGGGGGSYRPSGGGSRGGGGFRGGGGRRR